MLTRDKEGDQEGLEQAVTDSYANAEEIADFLSTANPDNWPDSLTRPMMEAHIETTTAYSVDLLEGDYQAAVTAYDEPLERRIMTADPLCRLIAQLHDQFEG